MCVEDPLTLVGNEVRRQTWSRAWDEVMGLVDERSRRHVGLVSREVMNVVIDQVCVQVEQQIMQHTEPDEGHHD